MQRRFLVSLVVLLMVACGDGSASDTTAVVSDPDLTVPDVVGESLDFARGVLETSGFRPDVIEVDDETSAPGIVVEQVPAAGAQAFVGATVVIKVAAEPTAVGGDGSEAGGDVTSTTVSTTAAPTTAATTTTTAGTTTTIAAGTTTTQQVGLTQQQCESHPYYEPRSDPNCSKAEYRLVVNATTTPRVWQCMSQGDGVYYNQDQPGNLACDRDRNAPSLYFQANPPAPAYPDYDPTIGSVDTFIECSWQDAQYILANYGSLSQGKQTLSGGWQWRVSSDNEVCIGR